MTNPPLRWRPSLAPMEGVTTFPMRLWFWLTSAPERMATPFLRAIPTWPIKDIPESFAPELMSLAGVLPYELIPQIMTAEAEDFIRSARLFNNSYIHIELNAGCPSPNCVGKGAGSSLLKDPAEFAAMIHTIAHTLGRERFAVKMRTGFQSHDEFPTLLAQLQNAPIKHLTVHGRTRPQGYKGQADWDLINQAASTLPYPVLASGDITSLEGPTGLLARLSAYPNVSGTLIGRGALRNPWLFEEIRSGQKQTITRTAIIYALATYGMLHELSDKNLPLLMDLVRDGVFTEPCFNKEDRWARVFGAVSDATFGQVLSPFSSTFSRHYVLDRRTSGRMKLLWNYIRSSMPESFFEPKVMRSSNPAALLAAISQLFEQNDHEYSLTYRSELDWIYNGEKNERQALAQQEPQAKESC